MNYLKAGLKHNEKLTYQSPSRREQTFKKSLHTENNLKQFNINEQANAWKREKT